jgi:ubiquinone/menaquinone biosynthesis C-methylase UbiE
VRIVPELQHELRLRKTRDERARANFVTALRHYVHDDMARVLARVWATQVAPRLEQRLGRPPRSGAEVHEALKPCEYFRFYSALRVTGQDLVYQVVAPPIERERATLAERARELGARSALGSLVLDPDFEVPRSVTAIDVHLMPGGYAVEYGPEDLTAGATYDNRLAVSSMGLMGENLDDIGQSIARFLALREPKFRPRRFLDLGCTIGHNTGAWKDVYPDMEVHAIDVAAPCLRYGLARARSQGRAIHFRQMNAERLDYPDASFDLVFSSMFLHEVPRAGIARVLREAYRVLAPGGLMLHMELPPNAELAPFDAFYLDWDGDYNNEPYYKPFRALDPRAAIRAAGFDPARYLQFVVPSIGGLGREAWMRAVNADYAVGSAETGRLAPGVRWFCFGAWK